jgi:hypothetical protein
MLPPPIRIIPPISDGSHTVNDDFPSSPLSRVRYGVNPLNPRENILAGAAVLANLLQRYGGDLRRFLQTYNASWTLAYEREVIRAYNQAKQFAMGALPAQKSQN